MAERVKKSRYLAALEDCEELIDRLESKKTVDFETFSEVWREMSFSLIYCSRPSEGELLDFTEEVLMAAKVCWMPPSHTSRRLVAAYVVYGLYFKQPVKDACKFRITHKDWKDLAEYYKFICSQDLPEHYYMFCKLIEHEAFTFCATPCELYLEKRTRRSDVLQVQMMLSGQGLNQATTSCLANFLNKGMFEKLSLIEDLYSKYKRRLQRKLPDFKGEQLSVDDLGHTLRTMCLQRTLEKCSTKPVHKPPEQKSIGERRQQLKNRQMKVRLRYHRPGDEAAVDPSQASLDELAYLHKQVTTGSKRKRRERGYHTIKTFRQCREAKELQRTGNYEVLHSKSTRSLHQAPGERSLNPRPRKTKRPTLDQLTGAADQVVTLRKKAKKSRNCEPLNSEDELKVENEEPDVKDEEETNPAETEGEGETNPADTESEGEGDTADTDTEGEDTMDSQSESESEQEEGEDMEEEGDKPESSAESRSCSPMEVKPSLEEDLDQSAENSNSFPSMPSIL